MMSEAVKCYGALEVLTHVRCKRPTGTGADEARYPRAPETENLCSKKSPVECDSETEATKETVVKKRRVYSPAQSRFGT